MDRKTRVPVTRVNMWYDQLDTELEMGFAKEFLENDANFRVVLFRIDHANTNHDDVYGESEVNEVRFHAPVELIVSALNVVQGELKSYGSSNASLTYQDRGNLEFAIMNSQLKEKGIDLKRGDVVGYNYSEDGLAYYSVYDDGRMNQDNAHTWYGTRPYYRSVKCVPVDPNQFNGL